MLDKILKLGRRLIQIPPFEKQFLWGFEKLSLIGKIVRMAPSDLPELKSEENLLSPPASVRGMKELDKTLFCKTVCVPCLCVPRDLTSKVKPIVKKYLLKLQKVNPVQDFGESEKKILLNPNKVKDFSTFIEGKDKLLDLGLSEECWKSCELKLNYDNWGADDILKAVLPRDVEGSSSYSIIGHIFHINLREHLEDFKFLIGQVLLEKNSQARTVINKIDKIDSSFRTFQIEILAGEDDMLTKVKENGSTYEFDFSKVYWNPRLGCEHERLVKQLNEGDVLYDVFAGVGPFAVPAAKKKCIVLANDLNPDSYRWLQHNVKANKVDSGVQTFNKDGGEFIRDELKAHVMKMWESDHKRNLHVAMNLPGMAVEFLKNFRGLFSREEMPETPIYPIVHVYCFTKDAADCVSAAVQLVESHLGSKLGDNLQSVFHVRTVSSNKEMMRVTFVIPEEVLFASSGDEEPAPKKPCLDSTSL